MKCIGHHCEVYSFQLAKIAFEYFTLVISMASSNIFLGYIERWSPKSFLSVFFMRHHLFALTSSVIRPSGSSPLGLAYTGEDSVVHHDLCAQQGDLVKVVWWAIEQQRLFETLATPFSHPLLLTIHHHTN